MAVTGRRADLRLGPEVPGTAALASYQRQFAEAAGFPFAALLAEPDRVSSSDSTVVA